MINRYILDTNIVTAVIKNNQLVTRKLQSLDIQGAEIFISVVTYFETKRGLLYSNATQKLSLFNRLCREWNIIFLDNLEIIDKACEIHATLKRQGRMIQDADILIAATAIIHDLILVSNDSDLTRISEVNLENWLE